MLLKTFSGNNEPIRDIRVGAKVQFAEDSVKFEAHCVFDGRQVLLALERYDDLIFN
jgi:hypothetical protein